MKLEISEKMEFGREREDLMDRVKRIDKKNQT